VVMIGSRGKLNPALHDAAFTMLNVNDKNVLSWLRKTTYMHPLPAVAGEHLVISAVNPFKHRIP
jgi:hypothetical protein